MVVTNTTIKRETLDMIRKLGFTPRQVLMGKDVDLALSILVGLKIRTLVMTATLKEALFDLYEEGLGCHENKAP